MEEGRGKSRSRSTSTSTASSRNSTHSEDEPTPKRRRLEPTAGRILGIKLENFMCHSTLDWEPKETNFLIGVNGSGKSSILQAIVLGLGGQARHVGRYSKLEDFVKKDCTKAEIKITLSNEGEEAYRQDYYGDSITFKRTIFASASANQNSIMGSDNKPRKLTKEETKNILEAFRIFIDNPLVILHQDTAKEFLNVEKPEKLYQLFMKGTMLDEITKFYGEAEANVEKTRQREAGKESEISKLERKIEQIKRDMAEYESIRNKRKELDLIQKQIAWRFVMELSGQLDELKKVSRALELALKNDCSTLTEEHRANRVLLDNIKEAKEKLATENEKNGKERAAFSEASECVERLRNQAKELGLQCRDVEKNKTELDKRLKAKKNSQARHHDKDSIEQSRLKKARLKGELADIERTITENRQRIDSEAHTIEDLKKDENMKENKRKELRVEMGQMADHIEREERVLEDLKQNKGHRLPLFGRPATLIDQQIREQKGRFKKMPIGPIGLYIKLAPDVPEEYAELIETHIGQGSLKSYICDNDPDRRVLQSIFKNIPNCPQPKVIVSRFLDSTHDNSNNFAWPTTNHRLMLHCLEVTDSQVYNHLIDQFQLEQIVICENGDQAAAITLRKENVPQNLSLVVSLKYYKYFPAKNQSNFRSYYIDRIPQHFVRFISGQDSASSLKMKEIDNLRAQLQKLGMEESELEMSIANGRRKITQIMDNKAEANKALKVALQNKSRVRSNLSSLDDVDECDLETDIAGLEAQTNQANADLLSLQTSREQAEMELDRATKKKDKLMTALHSKRSAEAGVLTEMLQQLEVAKGLKEKTIKKQEELIKQKKRKLQTHNFKMGEKSKTLASRTEEAEKQSNGEVLQPTDTLLHLRAKRKEYEKLTFTKEQVAIRNQKVEEFKATKSKLDKMKKDKEALDIYIKDLSEQCDRRKVTLNFVRNIVMSTSQRRFGHLSRKFSAQLGGEVRLDINSRERTVKIFFTSEDGEIMKKDLATLSGGEKSYIQMCLILSIWDGLQCPFRGLDEWDVYLDQVNRKKISNELLKIAVKKEGVQTIFISPQGATDMNSILSREERENVEVREVIKS